MERPGSGPVGCEFPFALSLPPVPCVQKPPEWRLPPWQIQGVGFLFGPKAVPRPSHTRPQAAPPPPAPLPPSRISPQQKRTTPLAGTDRFCEREVPGWLRPGGMPRLPHPAAAPGPCQTGTKAPVSRSRDGTSAVAPGFCPPAGALPPAGTGCPKSPGRRSFGRPPSLPLPGKQEVNKSDCPVPPA